jgi:4a-hydroxytetrahydrobiopterin dehydratase
MKFPLPILILLTVFATNLMAQTDREALVPVYGTTNLDRDVLGKDDITTTLKSLPGWEHQDGKLVKTYACGSFSNAVAFIVAISYHCEKLDHHPEIFNVYDKVQFTITTYDAGQRVTTADVKLATAIEASAAACTFNEQ